MTTRYLSAAAAAVAIAAPISSLLLLSHNVALRRGGEIEQVKPGVGADTWLMVMDRFQ